VNLRELFASFPARRRFLKQPSAESALCRQILVDKALPFPQVAFRLSSSGSTSLVLQPGSLLERVCQATSANLDPRLFRELICRGEGFQARIVAGDPALFRTDRKHVQVFVNRRKVQVYGIAQAIEYAYRGALPGGTWPFAYAFIDVDADKADFNIHPAKKDVRLVNTDDIRSALIRAIQDFLGLAARTSLSGKAVNSSSTYHDSPETSWAGIAAVVTEARVAGGFNRTGNLLCQNADSAASCQNSVGGMAGDPASNTSNSGRSSPGNTSGAATGLATDGASGAAASDSERPIHYLGRTLGVFLAYEDGDTLVLLDQHAAHERILYDELCSGKPASQELLVPVVYEAESAEDDAYLERIAPSLEPVGFRLVRDGSTWMLEAAPALLPSSGLGDVFNLIRSRPDPAELLREAIATIACHGAVRDGEALDDRSAQALIRRAMALPDPRCPHGRPIWIRLSRHDAWRAVRRIV
jgi:DNA mismatch repair protein MutL